MKRDKIQFSGRVEGGEIKAGHDRWVETELGEIEGEQVFITLEPIRDRRSLQANAFYWGVVVKTIADHTGQTPESLHEYFKARFLSETFLMTNKDGEVIDERTIVRSTTRLRVIAFSEYIQSIVVWANEFLGLSIPEAEHEHQPSQ